MLINIGQQIATGSQFSKNVSARLEERQMVLPVNSYRVCGDSAASMYVRILGYVDVSASRLHTKLKKKKEKRMSSQNTHALACEVFQILAVHFVAMIAGRGCSFASDLRPYRPAASLSARQGRGGQHPGSQHREGEVIFYTAFQTANRVSRDTVCGRGITLNAICVNGTPWILGTEVY